ncbi:hypothetical protein BpHYR1_033898 [Brachionus plicatilis]|uniref:Uncharacterized protein n=1 Tax=Brachionus plicatilis TaxID=10195 RepID=A0A3M7S651_BRAPC|nr:hypothetical protein BpHYR1_033898 [Brachionus plicatilis]
MVTFLFLIELYRSNLISSEAPKNQLLLFLFFINDLMTNKLILLQNKNHLVNKWLFLLNRLNNIWIIKNIMN